MSEKKDPAVPLRITSTGYSGYAEDTIQHFLERGCAGPEHEKMLREMLAEGWEDLLTGGTADGS